MATQELAGFLAAIILAQKTGLIDKILNAREYIQLSGCRIIPA